MKQQVLKTLASIVLSAFQWKELDETGHLMAVTTEKIYDHDRVNSEWDDKTQRLETRKV